MAVNAIRAASDSVGRARVTLVSGRRLASGRPWQEIAPECRVLTADRLSQFGICGAVGDLDGDGRTDLVIGGVEGVANGRALGRLTFVRGGPGCCDAR